MKVAYQIEFEHELLIGTGSGVPGLVDNVTLTDADGLPYIPRQTIKGILREQFRRLGIPEDIRERCFGSEFQSSGKPSVEGRFRFSDARYSKEDALPRDLADLERERRTRVKLDENTRAADDGKLFTFELARPSAKLRGVIYDDGPAKTSAGGPDQDLACLLLALRSIQEIGGWRRKGVGACRFIVDWENTPEEVRQAVGLHADCWEKVVSLALGEGGDHGHLESAPHCAQ